MVVGAVMAAVVWSTRGWLAVIGLNAEGQPDGARLAPLLSRLRTVFTPLVSGVVVLLIGTSLIPTAFFGLAASVRPGAPAWLGLVVGLTTAALGGNIEVPTIGGKAEIDAFDAMVPRIGEKKPRL